MARVPVEVRADMQRDATIKRSGHRIKRKHFPWEPSSAHRLILEGEWGQTKGEHWVIHENRSEANSCIILATNTNISYLKQSSVWYGDRTFCDSPRIYYQMYTIHCHIMRRILPMAYCFLANKTSESYKQIFEGLKNEWEVQLYRNLGHSLRKHQY